MALLPDHRKLPTMADVARAAGVSTATVSRALKHHPSVKEAMRLRVEEAAKRLGYEADPMLSALVRRRWQFDDNRASRHVALLSTGGLKREFHEAIQRHAAETRVIISAFDLSKHNDTQQLVRMLRARGVEGILFCVTSAVTDWDIPWEEFYCVAVGAFPSPFTQVVTDYFSAVNLSTEKALEYGYRRPGIIKLDHGNRAIDIRQTACVEYQRKRMRDDYGYKVPVLVVPKDEHMKMPIEERIRRVRAWYDRFQPDVIIDATNSALGNLRSTGVRFPEDCGYVSLFVANFAEIGDFAAIDEKLDVQAYWSLELLTTIMQSGVRGIPKNPPRMVIPCGWLDGATLPRKQEPQSSVKPAAPKPQRGGKARIKPA